MPAEATDDIAFRKDAVDVAGAIQYQDCADAIGGQQTDSRGDRSVRLDGHDTGSLTLDDGSDMHGQCSPYRSGPRRGRIHGAIPVDRHSAAQYQLYQLSAVAGSAWYTNPARPAQFPFRSWRRVSIPGAIGWRRIQRLSTQS